MKLAGFYFLGVGGRLFHSHHQIIMSNGLPPVPTSAAGLKGRASVTGYIREADVPGRKSRNYIPTTSTQWMRLGLKITRQVV